jgi:hypothetical protein
MLRQSWRYNFTPLPKKKARFWGVKVLEYFSEFLVFGKTLEQFRTFWQSHRPFPATFGHFIRFQN